MSSFLCKCCRDCPYCDCEDHFDDKQDKVIGLSLDNRFKLKEYHRYFCKGICQRELNGWYLGDCPYCSGLVEAQVWVTDNQLQKYRK